jgi:hypothetical protein
LPLNGRTTVPTARLAQIVRRGLQRAYYRRCGITPPRAVNDEPTLHQILAAGITKPLDD